MVRVLIVEDTATIRFILKKILNSDPDIEVVGEAADGAEAIKRVEELKPDLVTMDIRMPKMNGFEATQEIMQRCPTPILVISASVESEDLNIAFNAIKAGALDIVEKPKGNLSFDFQKIGSRIIQKVKILSEVRVITRRPRPLTQSGQVQKTVRSNRSNEITHQTGMEPEIVGIVSSTGGPKALLQLLKELDPTFPLPICIVQHITPGFGEGLVQWLNTESKLNIKFVEHGEILKPGTVYFSKDDHHMEVKERGVICLNNRPAVVGLRPYGNYLLDSIAEHYGGNSIGVILTGMGRDGAEGVRRMKMKGAFTIGQDEETSVVYGMPKEAYDIGGISIQLPLGKISKQLMECVSNIKMKHGIG